MNRSHMMDQAPEASGTPARPADEEGSEIENPLFLGTIAKCFHVLEIFNTERRAIGLTELARLSDMNTSAVQRIVHTLTALGYLQQNPKNRRLTLTSRMLEFGHTVLATHRLRERSLPHLELLRKTTGGTVNLLQLEGSEVVNIARFPGQDVVCVNLHVGSRLPAFCTSSGRALMANMKDCQAMAVLEGMSRTAMTAHTITDVAALMEKLRETRELGYSVNNEEAFSGDLAFAAPILNHDGTAMVAVNVSLPSAFWRVPEARTRIVPALLQTAAAIAKAA